MIWIVLAIVLSSIIISSQIYHQHLEVKALRIERQAGYDKIKAVTSELSSIRVKHGMTWETFLPLMDTFESELGPKENANFLGRPIDLIYFNEEEILFVEVKTGNSRLSSKQRRIRDLVKNRKIRWVEVNDSLKGNNPLTDELKISTSAMMTSIPHRPHRG